MIMILRTVLCVLFLIFSLPSFPYFSSFFLSFCFCSSLSSSSSSSSSSSLSSSLSLSLSDIDYSSFRPLIWFAPFFSGGGYCSEALSYIDALFQYYPSGLLSIQHHGDSFNDHYWKGLDDGNK